MVKCKECAYLKILRYKVSSDTYQCLIQDNMTLFNITKHKYCEFFYPKKTSANTVGRPNSIENDYTT